MARRTMFPMHGGSCHSENPELFRLWHVLRARLANTGRVLADKRIAPDR